MVDPVAFSLLSEVGSSFFILSITMIERSSMECPGVLKWAATGFSSFLLRMSLRYPLRRIWRGFCLSHVLQFAFPILDEVDDVPRLAGCCFSYVVGTAGGSAGRFGIGGDHMGCFLELGNCQVSLAQH